MQRSFGCPDRIPYDNSGGLELHLILGDLKSLRASTERELRKTNDIAIESIKAFTSGPTAAGPRKCHDLTWLLLTELQNASEELRLV
jgi:hypothetical protein